MHSVIFICTANRCRSPIAMTFMQDKVKSLALQDEWRIESAGTWTEDGLPLLEGAQMVMREKGFDLTTYRSRLLTGKLLRSFQLILTMESGHKEALQAEFPNIAKRVYLLSEMSGIKADIHYPAGKSLREFRAVTREIESFVTKGFNRISELAQVGQKL
jgi:protein-tyrosine phosphatase